MRTAKAALACILAAAALAGPAAAFTPPQELQTFGHQGQNSGSWEWQGFRELDVLKVPGPLEAIDVSGLVRAVSWLHVTGEMECDRTLIVLGDWLHGFALYAPGQDVALNFLGLTSRDLDQHESAGALVGRVFSQTYTGGHDAVLHVQNGDAHVVRGEGLALHRFRITDPDVLEACTLQPGEPPGTVATWHVVDGGDYALTWPDAEPFGDSCVGGFPHYAIRYTRGLRLAFELIPATDSTSEATAHALHCPPGPPGPVPLPVPAAVEPPRRHRIRHRAAGPCGLDLVAKCVQPERLAPWLRSVIG